MAHSRFHSLLRERVLELVESKAMSLAQGAAKDYNQYQLQVGVIQGLKDALAIAEEIEKEGQ